MSEEKIAEALGLSPINHNPKEEKTVEDAEIVEVESVSGEIVEKEEHNDAPVPSNTLEGDLENIKDIDFAKDNIKEIIERGDMSLTELIAIAKQSESPRAFEVVSTMMKTLLDANKEYVEMSTRKKYAKEESPAAAQTNVTNNNLILSTHDLLKMMKGEVE